MPARGDSMVLSRESRKHFAGHKFRKATGPKARKVERDELKADLIELRDDSVADSRVAKLCNLAHGNFDAGHIIGVIADTQLMESKRTQKLLSPVDATEPLGSHV